MLVLASGSPRRRALLREWGYHYEQAIPEIAEVWPVGVTPEEGVRLLAEQKALAGYALAERAEGDVVLGADTVVVLEGKVLGKPRDQADAVKMLTTLSGKQHFVLTGIALALCKGEGEPQVQSAVDKSTVTFNKLSARVISDYVRTGEPLDKAGAYGYQGSGRSLVRGVKGSEENVIGLPMTLLAKHLAEFGIVPATPDERSTAELTEPEPPALLTGSEPQLTESEPPALLTEHNGEDLEQRPGIGDMPSEMKPRERMFKVGAEALSPQELLAILLGTGVRGENAIGLAEKLLANFGGMRELSNANLQELVHIPGIGMAKAAQIAAAVEWGRRLTEVPLSTKPIIHSPSDVASMLMERLRNLDREHFYVVLLNTKSRVISVESISVGSLNLSLVHPRECFKAAVRYSAMSLILVHNHPSGDPTPSKADIEISSRLAECGKIMGIAVLDHLIIGDNCYTSLKETGEM
jgi:DNA repair protein RadC